MSARCPDRSILDQFDTLAGGPRRELLVHVKECAACRAAVLREDPARVFALLALTPVEPRVLDAVSARVNAALAAGSMPRRSWAPVAGWAAAALLAVIAARSLWGPLRPSERANSELASVMELRAGVEVLSPADPRQVVDLTVGDSQVVMIFDERLRL